VTLGPSRHTRAALLVVVLAVVLIWTGSAATGRTPASADPSVGDARQRATALAAQVHQLEARTELATEQYDAIQEQLGQVVNRYVAATQQVGDLSAAAEALRVRKVQRIRALYMSGGQLGLYVRALDTNDIGQVMTQLTAVNNLLNLDSRDITAGNAKVTVAEVDQSRLDQLANERTRLQIAAQQAKQRVLGLLAERQQQLADADELVLRLVAEQEQRAEEAAAAAAARMLGTAPTAPITLPPGTPAVVVAAIDAARTRLGLPYVWGATGPTTFDCSGLTQWAYAQAGVTLPRTSREQWYAGPHPALEQLLPGDLLFWAIDPTDPSTIHHVALYIGDGYMIEAPHPGAVVHVTPVYLDGYFGATRPVG
jgi:cell wall-associated NlpC family hydrolase